MRDLIKLIEQAQGLGDLILRDAFLYLPPKGDPDDFAQCGSCGMFIPDQQRCWLFGADHEVVANASCGLYINGQPSNDQQPQNKVTPEQAGYNLGQVRCENCKWLDGTTCELYVLLNEKLPQVFDLDTKVNPYGCCNAWQN
jgi:hypothetical protein